MTVTLNKDEIFQRANGVMREFADAYYEMGEAQNFIRGLCDVFGFSNKRMVSFEQRVKKLGGKCGRIDGFYPGKLLIEMKSKGEDLDQDFKQATQYLPDLSEAELPTYCLVSDFENLHLYDLSAFQAPRSSLMLANLLFKRVTKVVTRQLKSALPFGKVR